VTEFFRIAFCRINVAHRPPWNPAFMPQQCPVHAQILSQMKKKAFLGEKSLDITSPLW
jgi:hypothetical protein